MPTKDDKGGYDMIKFRDRDGNTSMTLSDSGDLEFESKIKEQEYKDAKIKNDNSEIVNKN